MIEVDAFLVGTLAAILGGIVHSSVGFGFSLVAVPIVALAKPEAVPATLLLLSLPVNFYMLRGEGSVDVAGAGRMALGTIVGTAVGTWVLATVAPDDIGLVFGIALLVAAVAAGVRPALRVTPTREVVVGMISGIMGTTTAIAGPPLAILYSSRDGRTLRSTLAVTFLVGVVLALVALTAIGRLAVWHVVYATALAPGMAVGLLLGHALRPILDARWLRPAVLAVAGGAGLYAIAGTLAT